VCPWLFRLQIIGTEYGITVNGWVPIYWLLTHKYYMRIFDLAGTINDVSISDANYDDLTSHILDNQNIIEWVYRVRANIYDRIEYSLDTNGTINV